MGLFDNINFSKLKAGLSKTRERIVNTINETITGKAVIDDKTLDEIEEILVSSDIGVTAVEQIIENSRKRLKSGSDRSDLNLVETIKLELERIINVKKNTDNDKTIIEQYKPYVILIIGVNGSGKTTTIGKLAYNYKQGGKKVLVSAADTFRAAAGEQLEIWAQRAGVDIVQKNQGADPSSVVFDTIQKAIKENYDLVLIDTAGRLHNKANLMSELEKIKRVISRQLVYAPNETLLVLDGNTGQNAIVQAEEFSRITDVSGLIITKLDGTAKGGVVYQIASNKNIPVKYIGVGEGIDDLQAFDARLFVSALFDT